MAFSSPATRAKASPRRVINARTTTVRTRTEPRAFPALGANPSAGANGVAKGIGHGRYPFPCGDGMEVLSNLPGCETRGFLVVEPQSMHEVREGTTCAAGSRRSRENETAGALPVRAPAGR